jgi:predicted alpha/beta superfamily hydrolase
MGQAHVHVIYPDVEATIVLRSSEDWERDIDPVHLRDGARHYVLSTERPYVELKACLLRDGEALWSQGENVIAVAADDGADSESLALWPYFLSDARCSVCTLTEVSSSETGAFQVRVYLPPGYQENPCQRYPVLYMQDGHNLFLASEAASGDTWRVRETMAVLDRINAIRPVIVVGIRPNRRMEEYVQPGYEVYGRFMVRDLKPLIDARYRTLSDPAHTAVMGSSLGGVVSLYLGWEYPAVFGMVGALSSTFGYADDLMQRVAREAPRPVRFYLDSGFPLDNYEASVAMATQLIRRGYEPGRDVLYMAFPFAKHNEAAWASRCHLPFQFFFGMSMRLGGRM